MSITIEEKGKEKLTVHEGEEFEMAGSDIDSVSIPVNCNICGKRNLLTANKFAKVESKKERGLGREIFHHADLSSKCSDCGAELSIHIGLREYPEANISFEETDIEEGENCTYERNDRTFSKK